MATKTKKYGILALLAVLVIGIVLTSGCMEEQKEKTGETPNKTTNETQLPAEQPKEQTASTEKPNETQLPTEKPATEQPTETLSEILGRGAGISSVKYDMIMTSQGMPSMTQKVWLKKNKMKTEATMEGQTMIYLTDMDTKTMYTYMPAQNMAMKTAMKIDFSNDTKPATESTESIEKYKPVVIGTETLDGKVCTVVEYTTEEGKIKSWIWKEKGFSIRMEMTTAEGKVIVEYKNIEFANIPDSMFELPAGVEITEMPTGMQ